MTIGVALDAHSCSPVWLLSPVLVHVQVASTIVETAVAGAIINAQESLGTPNKFLQTYLDSAPSVTITPDTLDPLVLFAGMPPKSEQISCHVFVETLAQLAIVIQNQLVVGLHPMTCIWCPAAQYTVIPVLQWTLDHDCQPLSNFVASGFM